MQHKVKVEVAKAKQKAYNDLHARLDSMEGKTDLYRLARQRARDGKDVQQVRVIKDREGNVLTDARSVMGRWKTYFEELMNEEIERRRRVEVTIVDQEVAKISKGEVRRALKRMKSGKAVDPDDIPVEVWKCLGEVAVEFLTRTFNKILESERMPEEWTPGRPWHLSRRPGFSGRVSITRSQSELGERGGEDTGGDISQSRAEQPKQPQLKNFPRTYQGDRRRCFSKDWYNTHKWLEYSQSKDSAYCYACRHLSLPSSALNPSPSPQSHLWYKQKKQVG
ncbi:uncharacterized protein AKAME5_000254900 [Lates japonicus]|uniref:Uncharacterized protein n=1 Tax=Lates japonicus TaxID=270547 RepID=A0AAD3M6X1_LATJO|nr:uncharacterized protein AKAME5_000254900 [Lates japonicus]